MVASGDLQLRDLEPAVRAMAGGKLCTCAKTEYPGLENLDARCHGTDESLMVQYLLDAINLRCKHGNGEVIGISTLEGKALSSMMKLQVERVEVSDLECSLFLKYGIDDAISSEMVSYDEEDEYEDVTEDIEEVSLDEEVIADETEEVPSGYNQVPEDTVTEDIEDTEDVGESEAETQGVSSAEDDTEIEGINSKPEDEGDAREIDQLIDKAKRYESQYKSSLQDMADIYQSMFASGYSVRTPTGVLCRDGIVTLSGTSHLKTLKDTSKSSHACARPAFSVEDDIAMSDLYDFVSGKLGFRESDSRSINNISNEIISEFRRGGNTIIYFPYKMLEFVYGRVAPKGTDANSKNTYTKQAVEKNWDDYYSKHVELHLQRLLGRSIGLLIEDSEKSDMDRSSMSAMIKDFTAYFIKCFSLCILIPEYRTTPDKLPIVLKLRISDPQGKLGTKNIMPDIVNFVYNGYFGADPQGQEVAIYGAKGIVKEYVHEFNQKMSQAMPIFAYKALEVLQAQGINPTWDDMVLGQYENGSILRNGQELSVAGHGGKAGSNISIKLNEALVHVISAGSRAGKGVTTLSFLTNAISSGKAIFYIDRKPDMASVMKEFVNGQAGKDMPPLGMFVMNGAAWDDKSDAFKQWANPDSFLVQEHIPDYALSAYKISSRENMWYGGLGDIFYMRAFKLAYGLAIARGAASNIAFKPELGGNEGIVVIADETTNFQNGFIGVMDPILSKLPPRKTQLEKTVSTIEQKMKELEIANEKSRIGIQAVIDSETRNLSKYYTDEGFYALTILKSMENDIVGLSSINNAAWYPEATKSTDVLLIGQDLVHKKLTDVKVKNIIEDGRYSSNTIGAKSGVTLMTEGTSKLSLMEALIRFGKPVDAILGRNDATRNYLDQCSEGSPSKSKLNDKARYFAFLSSFSEQDQANISSRALADRAVYFKPYLILNDCQPGEKQSDGFRAPGETYTATLLGFSSSNGLSEADLVQEYGNGEEVDADHPNGTFLHPSVGLGAYLQQMGVTNLPEVLSKSGKIADTLVRDYLGYTGDPNSNASLWFQFVTDLRMEWEFSVNDIVECVKSPRILSANNPNMIDVIQMKEEIAKVIGGSTSESGEIEVGGSGDSFEYRDFNDNDSRYVEVEEDDSIDEDDYTDEDTKIANEASSEYILEDLMSSDEIDSQENESSGSFEGEFDDIFSTSSESAGDSSPDSTFDLRDDPDDLEGITDEEVIVSADGSQAFNVAYNHNTINTRGIEEALANGEISDDDLISILEKRGLSVSKPLGNDARVNENGAGLDTSYKAAPETSAFTMEDLDSGRRWHTAEDEGQVDFHNISSTSPKVTDEVRATSYRQLVKVVTNKFIKDFGGLGRIATFKVVGGGIVANNILYKCSVDSSSAKYLPLDIREQINSGQIACLFDYSCLLSMKNLNTLSVDSVDHAYNYIAPMLGYSSGVSVDKFFHDLKSLNVLTLGNDTYTRENYREKLRSGDDTFYAPSKAAQYTNAVHSGVKKANQSVWNATKNVAGNRSYPNIIRFIGAVGLGAVALGLGVARLGTAAAKNTAEETSARKNDRGYIDKARGFFGGIGSSIKDAFDNGNQD